ncbi:MAG TPA: oxidoreductase [Prolixibacteraceae bacterium]|nr:oxidoreductase [Prolixibacteraceae bacterium]
MSKLLSPLTIKDITFKNRIAISPMCQYSAWDGYANNWHLVHYGSRAVGGAGLIIQEATGVSPEGRITPGDLGIYLDEHLENLTAITTFVKQHGGVPGIQLAHAGRKAGCSRPWDGGKQLPLNEGGWRTVAPSPIPFFPHDEKPEELDLSGIMKVVADFRSAAARALDAGFQVLEIHAAHGYLIHEFLSPITNQRKDSYGGTFENRIRLLIEIVRAVQTVWPSNMPLFVRISATDWVNGGWDIDEAVKLASKLKSEGVDLIDTSSGGLVPDAIIPFAPGYQVDFASRIRKETDILTGAVGLITSISQAEEILNADHADLILIARESLRNPYFGLTAGNELAEEVDWPVQYIRAK